MKSIKARSLLKKSTDELWNTISPESVVLVFDDGEIVTNGKECCYSSYIWDFHRQFPDTPLLLKHHVTSVLNGKRLGNDTHLALLGNAMWSVYDTYVLNGIPKNGMTEPAFRDMLAEMIYRQTNLMYNDLSYRLEEYVTSLDILDFIEVLNHPAIKQANENVQASQKSLDETYAVIKDTLMTSPDLNRNPVARAARSRISNMGQILQCVGPRGYLTDTDSHVFKVPVLRGYAQGIRSFYDSLIESRSSAKALMFSKTPLQQAEYFSRRLQLMSQIVQNLHQCDCGTTEYLLWTVRGPRMHNGNFIPGDLPNLLGKKYLDDDGVLKTITSDSKYLVGRTIKMRSAIHCAHPDPYGICTTCFGELSLSVPEDTNIGQMCCTSLAQKSSQAVLSTKHLDGSSVVEGIILQPNVKQYLKVAADDNSYLLHDDLKNKFVELIILADNATNITDILEVKHVEQLNITRVSELSEIGLRIVDNGKESLIPIEVNIGRRLASMTTSLLKHIRNVGWGVNASGNYTIDMSGWNWKEAFLTLPLKHVNLSDHSASIASMLESSVDMMQERDNNVSPDNALVELFDLVNEKLSVNLAVLDVVLYGVMITSAEKYNYALPKPWTARGLGVMKMSMAMRSLSASMAFEGHREILTSPLSYTVTNRPNHIFDTIMLPQELVR